MNGKIKMEMTIKFGGGTMGDLRKVMRLHDSIPDNAQVTIKEFKTYRGEPGGDPQKFIITWEENVDTFGRDDRPHSRACGIMPHSHGVFCKRDCPTCGGKPL